MMTTGGGRPPVYYVRGEQENHLDNCRRVEKVEDELWGSPFDNNFFTNFRRSEISRLKTELLMMKTCSKKIPREVERVVTLIWGTLPFTLCWLCIPRLHSYALCWLQCRA